MSGAVSQMADTVTALTSVREREDRYIHSHPTGEPDPGSHVSSMNKKQATRSQGTRGPVPAAAATVTTVLFPLLLLALSSYLLLLLLLSTNTLKLGSWSMW